MGGKCSKKNDPDTPSPLPQINPNFDYNADLNLYEEACARDPELQSFDATLHERTNRFINTLAAEVAVGALSFDSLNEVTRGLLAMNQEAFKIILDCKKDIWKNRDLSALVEEYFDSSAKTLDYCTALENCLKRARNSQLMIQAAIRQFEEEVQLQDEFAEKKYVKTLEQLQRFKEAGDPFTEEFSVQFRSVHQQQESMLKKLVLRKRKLHKKLKCRKKWRRVCNVLFVVTFVSVLVFSVVAAAITAPPVVIALAGALAVPLGSLGKWHNSLWNKYVKEVKEQWELVSYMRFITLITSEEMKGIRALVRKLEIYIESSVQNADFALTQEDAVSVKLVIGEIKKNSEEFMENIRMLGELAGNCSQTITEGRTVILQRIVKYSDNRRTH